MAKTLQSILVGCATEGDQDQQSRLKEQAQAALKHSPATIIKNSSGKLLFSLFLDETMTEDYLQVVRAYLSGGMGMLDSLLESDPYVLQSLMDAANFIYNQALPYDEECASPTLYRGINLKEKLKLGSDRLLPFNPRFKLQSYTEDPEVAIAFARGGSGYPYVVTAKPNPRRVVFHYSYLVKYAKAFEAGFVAETSLSYVLGEESRGLSKPDVFNLLPQREVLIKAGSGLKQRVMPIDEFLVDKNFKLYKPEDPDDVERRYKKAMKHIAGMMDPKLMPTAAQYKAMEKIRDEVTKSYTEGKQMHSFTYTEDYYER